jgi:hypothetical protein
MENERAALDGGVMRLGWIVGDNAGLQEPVAVGEFHGRGAGSSFLARRIPFL